MSVLFEIHSMPNILNDGVRVNEEAVVKISKRLKRTNRKLEKKMKAIDQKEKRNWQKSLIRNSFQKNHRDCKIL